MMAERKAEMASENYRPTYYIVAGRARSVAEGLTDLYKIEEKSTREMETGVGSTHLMNSADMVIKVMDGRAFGLPFNATILKDRFALAETQLDAPEQVTNVLAAYRGIVSQAHYSGRQFENNIRIQFIADITFR
jgi:hypothetical protein